MGRGILFGLLNRGFFILGGYIIHVYAGRVLSPSLYGTFGVVLAVMTLSAVFLNNGVRQTVSRHISRRPEATGSIYRKGLALQAGLAGLLGLLVFFGAEPLASAFADPALVVPLRICLGVILVQSLFHVQIGALNGQKAFFRENLIGSLYGLAKPLATVLLIAAGFGVSGAVAGFFLAGLLAAAAGGWLMRRASSAAPAEIKIRDLLRGSLLGIVIFGALSVLLHADLLFVKYFVREGLEAGYYTAAAAFSKPAYWVLFSLGTVLLPLLSSGFAAGDLDQCRRHLGQAFRFSTLLVLPAVVLIAATAEEFIVFFYGSAYAPAGQPLAILTVGIYLLGVTSLLVNALLAMGHERLLAWLGLGAIATDLILNAALVPRLGMSGAALATSLCALGFLGVSATMLARKIRFRFRFLSWVRLGILCLALIVGARSGLLSDFPLLLRYGLLYSAFLVALVMIREIGKEDWQAARRLIGLQPDPKPK